MLKAIKKLFLTLFPDSGIRNVSQAKGKNEIMSKEVNYTEAQVARIEAAAPVTNEVAIELAAEFGKDVRSVRAKAARMGVYQKAERKAKNGDPIERKEAIVADIQSLIGANMEGLEKAPKAALVRIRSALSA